MKEYSEKSKEELSGSIKVGLWIAIFFSSIGGALLFGVSLNMLALFLLEIILFIKTFCGKIRCNKLQFTYALWYLLTMVSSVSGIIYAIKNELVYTKELISANLNDAIGAVAICLPIALMIWSSPNRESIRSYAEKVIVYTVRIQCVWSILQFVCYYLLKFDINGYIFNQAFGGALGGEVEWGLFYNNGETITLRITGLGHEPALLGALIIVGICLEKRLKWRILYVFVAILTMTRSTIVAICFLGFMEIMRMIKKHYVSDKRLRKSLVAIFMLLGIGIAMYSYNQSIRGVVDNLMGRLFFFLNDNSGESLELAGTLQHAGYPIAAVVVILFLAPFLQRLFGVGVSCCGILLTRNISRLPFLELGEAFLDTSKMWMIECDWADMLCGMGLVGTIVFCSFLVCAYKCADYRVKKLIITMAFFGVMYKVSNSMFIQLVYICIYTLPRKSSLVKLFYGTQCLENKKGSHILQQ